MKIMNKKKWWGAHNQGQIVILNTLFFLAIALLLIAGIASPLISHYSSMQSFIMSKQSFLLADSTMNEALYRLKNGVPLPASVSVTLPSGTATINLINIPTGKRVLVNATSSTFEHDLRADMVLGTGISFHYGIQSGRGGFFLQNSSSVTGNVFSGGQIVGDGSCGTNLCTIYGDIISSGSGGLIDGVHATGTAYAHVIQNSKIGKDAYYVNISNTTVGGTLHPNSADQPYVDLPISDAQISQWENDAAAGGTAPCNNGAYNINSDVVLGPIKIPCNLNINGTGGGINVTIRGPVWVTGNITTSQKSTIKMDPALGSQNVAVIADNPNDQSGSGIINISQNTVFQGSGSVGSFVFMISQNNSSETGGSTNALVMNNGASALVAYAIHGQITLSQSVSIKEVTSYKIILQNSANVIYDAGLPSTIFESGPSGGYDMIGWSEI